MTVAASVKMRGTEGFKIGDKVELNNGETVKIDGIGHSIATATEKSLAIFESSYPNRKFRVTEIKRLVRPANSTVYVTCSNCQVSFQVFKEEKDRYAHKCADCVHEQEQWELHIFFDQEGKLKT